MGIDPDDVAILTVDESPAHPHQYGEQIDHKAVRGHSPPVDICAVSLHVESDDLGKECENRLLGRSRCESHAVDYIIEG